MRAAGNATPAILGPATGLRDRLRSETAEWHAQVEVAADLPRSVRSRDDYIELLSRLYQLHSAFESQLSATRFDPGWRAVGVDIAAHRRAHLLTADIEGLEATLSPNSIRRIPLPPVRGRLATFGHAVGCLYVLEGSSLGGRIVAGVVQATIGDVPTAFLTGEGRSRVGAWPAVLAALRRFDDQGGASAHVVAGACETFAEFAAHLSRVPRQTQDSARSR